MKIPQEIIDRVLRETDIVEIINEVTPLKRAGSSFKGCCPFHQEKTPSFNVNVDKQVFYCFGCAAGGNVVTFVMKTQGLSFPEAVKFLAGKRGIVVPEAHESPEEKRQASEAELMLRVNSYAQWFFRDQFKKSASTKKYWQNRGVSEAVSERFEIGFAPDGFHGLCEFLKDKKIPLALSEKLGLTRRSAKNGDPYDFFRNRLMFPIWSRKGDLIGFGGRALGQDAQEAKYVNSPESPIYRKSEELYGFHQHRANIAKTKRAVIVEGYVDVIACSQIGLELAVAPLGTSLTPQQVRMLGRTATDIILMFDGDAAGRKATLRSFEICLEAGIHPRVVALPDGRDPGDFLKGDAPDWSTIIEKAPFALDWWLAGTLATTQGGAGHKAHALKEAMGWLERLPDEFEQHTYRARFEEVFGKLPGKSNKVVENASRFAKPAGQNQSLTLEERVVLAALLSPQRVEPGEWAELAASFEPGLKQLAEALSEIIFAKQETFDPKLTISRVPIETQGLLSRLLTAPEAAHLGQDVTQCLAAYRQKRLRQRLRELTSLIVQAETAGDTARQMQLLSEKQKLLRDPGPNIPDE